MNKHYDDLMLEMYFNKLHSCQPSGCCTDQALNWRCFHRTVVWVWWCGGGTGTLGVQEEGVLQGGDTVGVKHGVGA